MLTTQGHQGHKEFGYLCGLCVRCGESGWCRARRATTAMAINAGPRQMAITNGTPTNNVNGEASARQGPPGVEGLHTSVLMASAASAFQTMCSAIASASPSGGAT